MAKREEDEIERDGLSLSLSKKRKKSQGEKVLEFTIYSKKYVRRRFFDMVNFEICFKDR